jgi:HAD superfamily hydrolase (TIGR01549 family)
MRAVLIDLDDTLFDHAFSSRAGLTAVCAEEPMLAALPFERVAADHAEVLELMHLEVLAGRMDLEAARAERFRRLLSGYGCSADAAAAAARYRASYLTARQALPGALALLGRLRGAALVAIVTNNAQTEQEEKLAHLGMSHLVDALVASERAGIAKPDPAIFRAALRELGSDPADAVMLGDSWSADVVGARAAGIRAIWLNRHGRPCPDPTMAHEIKALEPVEQLVALLLQ